MEKPTVQQRFQLIELLTYWEGRINAKDLEQRFHQSRQQSSQDVSAYKQHAPKNLQYDASLKAYLPTESFKPYFVLSRFRGIPELESKTENTQEKDISWNTKVTVILQPDPRLSPQKQAVLANDYQMQNGQLQITTRGCLVQYLLRELQVSTKVWDGTPEAQQLVCVNLPDIKQWLFEG